MANPVLIDALEPAQVAALQHKSKVILIDVREPTEYAAERIPGALLYPLSTFGAACCRRTEIGAWFFIADAANALRRLQRND